MTSGLKNPGYAWYGLRKGYRGRFRDVSAPLVVSLGKVELSHEPRNNKVRAIVESYDDLSPSEWATTVPDADNSS